MTAPNRSLLDAQQCIRGAYVDADGAFRVDINADEITLSIDSSTDSIEIATQAGVPLAIEPNGSLNVNVEGLDEFQTSRYTVGTSAIQLTPTPLSNRSAVSIKVITTSASDAVYIGNSNGVTSGNGYFLFNADVLNMDLTSTQQIWAIGSSAGQLIAVLEIGD